MPPDLILADPGFSAGGPDASRKNSNRSRLPRAVGTQQAEDLTRLHFKRNSIQSYNVSLVLGLPPPANAEQKASSTHRRRRRRGVYFAQIVGSNPYSHVQCPSR